MDAEKLRALQIRSDAKDRSHGSLWIIFLGVALVTGTGIYFAWPRNENERRMANGVKPLPNSSAKAAAAPSTPGSTETNLARGVPKTGDSVLTVSGYIVNRERIELSPRFMGLVKWIGVKKGDAVTNGQIVVLLDDSEHRARVLEAEGHLGNARAAATKAELDYDRIKKLITDRIESKQNDDDARLRLESTRAMVQEAQGQLDLARTYLGWTIIRSTIDGVVLEKLVDAGELVTPQSFGGVRGPSTALVAIADPKDLQVEIDLNEADLAKVSLDQRCRVSPEAYPEKSYQGHVAEIAPEANRQKGTLQVKVQIHSPDHFLTPELTAKVDFLSGKETEPSAKRDK